MKPAREKWEECIMAGRDGKTSFAPGEVIKEIVIAGLMAGLVDGLREGLRGGGKEVGGKIGEKTYQRLIEEKRSELLAFIHRLELLDATASKNIFSRQQARQECKAKTYGDLKSYLPGDEDKMIHLLTKLYIAIECIDKEKNACNGNQEECVKVFKWLGNLSDEEFDAKIEFLNHDSVVQWLMRLKVWAKDIFTSAEWQKVISLVKMALAKINSVADNLATELQPTTDRLDAELQKSKQITRDAEAFRLRNPRNWKGGIRSWFDF